MTSVSTDTASPRIGLLPKLVRFVLTVVIATVLGPLIGGVTYFLGFTAVLIAQSKLDTSTIGEMFIIIIIGAYVFGGVVAFPASTIVAAAALWRKPTFVIIIAVIVVVNVAYYVVTPPGGFYLYYPEFSIPFGFFVMLALSAFAATICWLLFRRLLRNR